MPEIDSEDATGRDLTGSDDELDELLADADDGIRIRDDLLAWRDAALTNYRPHNLWSWLGYAIEDNRRTARVAIGWGLATGAVLAAFVGLVTLVSYGIAHV